MYQIFITDYPLVICYIAIENDHLQWIFPLNMVISHSFVNIYQRVDFVDSNRMVCLRFFSNCFYGHVVNLQVQIDWPGQSQKPQLGSIHSIVKQDRADGNVFCINAHLTADQETSNHRFVEYMYIYIYIYIHDYTRPRHTIRSLAKTSPCHDSCKTLCINSSTPFFSSIDFFFPQMLSGSTRVTSRNQGTQWASRQNLHCWAHLGPRWDPGTTTQFRVGEIVVKTQQPQKTTRIHDEIHVSFVGNCR